MNFNLGKAESKDGNKLVLFEKILFVVVLIAAVSPLFYPKWYHTGDGPFHLYSATVLNDILFHSGATFGNYFEIHLAAVPNTIVLLLQAFLIELFPPDIVIKITLLSICLFMVIAYIYLLRSINPANTYTSALILPMLINYFTMMGFFSFLVSLGLMLITIGFFIRKQDQLSKKNMAILFILIVLNWFTHIVGCGISLACITIIFLFRKKSFKEKIILGILLLLIAILTFSFGAKALFTFTPKFESFKTLWTYFKNSSPLICYASAEMPIIGYFQLLLIISLPVSIYFFISKKEKKNGFNVLLFTLILLLLFFVMPATFFSGKLINYRVLFCFLLFLCAFIESNLPNYASLLLLPLVFYITWKKNEVYHPIIVNYSNEVQNIVSTSKHLKPGTPVVVLNYSDNWLHYNIGLYPSFCNQLIILDNDEAASPNSIIRWQKEKTPSPELETVLVSNKPLLKLDYEKKTGSKIGAVIRWSYVPSDDEDTKATNAILNTFFIPQTRNEKTEIFLRN